MRSRPARTLGGLLALSLSLGLALPAQADIGYAGCSNTDAAIAFDTGDGTPGPPIDLLPEGNYPYDATIRPDGSEVWIPGASGDGVIVLDRATGAIAHRIATGEYPVSVAFSRDGALALVSCRDSDRLDIVDTASYAVTGSLPIPNNYLGPGNVALDPVSGNFYVVEWYDDTLYEIAPDASAVLRSIPLGSSLWQLVVAPDGATVYLTDRGTDQLRAVDRASLIEGTPLAVGDDPWGLDVTADGATLVVCCEDDNTVQVVDVGAWTATTLVLPADADPRDLDILDAAGMAFVCGGDVAGDDVIYLVDLSTATLADTYILPGSNTNVVAVQAQAAGSGTAVTPAPVALTLSSHPNPFNPTTRLRFALPAAGAARLSLHDVQGRELRVLIDGWLPAGEQDLTWDGRDGSGRLLPGGLYFARLAGPTAAKTVKLVLLK
jgi:DNA-binding beta-propeller fold protein YncE